MGEKGSAERVNNIPSVYDLFDLLIKGKLTEDEYDGLVIKSLEMQLARQLWLLGLDQSDGQPQPPQP